MNSQQKRICRTADEAFSAGWDTPCTHGVADPTRCPQCRLTPTEISRMASLHRPYVTATPMTEAA